MQRSVSMLWLLLLLLLNHNIENKAVYIVCLKRFFT